MTGPQELAGVRHLMQQGSEMSNEIERDARVEAVESAAKAVFQQLPGWCGQPWVDGGNSLKQDEARRYARAVLAAADAAQGGEARRVYLVATGEAHEGQETYTRHDDAPPLCDFECLYTHPAPAAPAVPEGWRVWVTESETESALNIEHACAGGIAFIAERGSIRAELMQRLAIDLSTAPKPEAVAGWPDAADWLEKESTAVYGVCLPHHAEAAQWLRDTSSSAQATPQEADRGN